MNPLIYLLVGSLFGIFAERIARHYRMSEWIKNLSVVVVIILSLFFSNIYIVPYFMAETYDMSLRFNEPIFNTFKEKFPHEYSDFIKEMKTAIKKNKSNDDLLILKIKFINSLFILSAPRATNQSLYQFYQKELELDHVLLKINPKFVLYIEFSDKFKNEPNSSLLVKLGGEKLFNSIMHLKENVILSAIKTPQPLITKQDQSHALNLLDYIFKNLSNEFNEKSVSELAINPNSSLLNPMTAASIVISFTENILDQGVDNAGMIYKYLASKASSS